MKPEDIARALAVQLGWPESAASAHGIALDTLRTYGESEYQRGWSEGLCSAAMLAEGPYGNLVQAYGSDEPIAVGRKIARAIRSLLAPEEES